MPNDDLTPTTSVVKKANKIMTTTDSTGKIIKYRKLKPSDMLDLVSLIGSERSMNPIALSMCSAAFKVTEIDGIPTYPPDEFNDLKVIMDDLDDEGLSAMYETNRVPEVKKDKSTDEKPVEDKKEKK